MKFYSIIIKVVKFIRHLFSNAGPGQSNDVEIQNQENIDEHPDHLNSITVKYYFCSFRNFLSADYFSLISQELGVPESRVEEHVRSYFSGVPDETFCCLEYPYVEEYYRDTYYSFYARKHNDYKKNCFRLSFFSNEINEDNFLNVNIGDKFLGYVVLRPTPRRIIGYAFISPRLFPGKQISICICKRLISVMGRSLETTGFPFLSHDGEALSCSENSILLIFDYFSRRYNNYARTLPSKISEYASNNSGRYQPSVGLLPEEANQIFNTLGMTTRMYTRKDKNPSTANFEFAKKDFNRLLQIFVESGIPVYASTAKHSFLVVGRENKLFEQNARFVIMDGNKSPYHIAEDMDEVETFIVPMPDNILSDAQLIKPVEFYKEIENISEIKDANPQISMLDDRVRYVHRIFMTTSRSFKKHIIESSLDNNDKMLVVCTSMPKFVWVSESIDKRELSKMENEVMVDALGVYDATDYPADSNHILLAKSKENMILPTEDDSRQRRKKFSIFECRHQLSTFQFNLKGIHTQWQG